MVGLVHRPKYDDWSLPKGKLEPGEHPLLAAVREAEEETGFGSRPGRYLGETRYAKNGVPKRVRYWTLQATGGRFRANAEVDELLWLPPSKARDYLASDHDRPLLDAFVEDATPTWPCLLVRHGSAGERASWPGPDAERPLDPRGHAQAEALSDLLAAYGVERLLSADVRRCLDTVRPYAASRRLAVDSEPLVSERGHGDHPGAARQRVLEVLVSVAREGRPTAICTQGGVIDDLVSHACRSLGRQVPPDPSAGKGGFWVLHLAADGSERGAPRLVAVERFDPPA